MRQFSALSAVPSVALAKDGIAKPENWRMAGAGKRTYYAKLDGAVSGANGRRQFCRTYPHDAKFLIFLLL